MLRHAAGGWTTAVGAHHGGRAPPRGTGQLTAQRAGAVSAFVSVHPQIYVTWLSLKLCKSGVKLVEGLGPGVGNGPQLLR